MENCTILEKVITLIYENQNNFNDTLLKNEFISNCSVLYKAIKRKKFTVKEEGENAKVISALLLSMIIEEGKFCKIFHKKKFYFIQTVNIPIEFNSVEDIIAFLLELFVHVERKTKSKICHFINEDKFFKINYDIILIEKEKIKNYLIECIKSLIALNDENKDKIVLAYKLLLKYFLLYINEYKRGISKNFEKNANEKLIFEMSFEQIFKEKKICTDLLFTYFTKVNEDKDINNLIKEIIKELISYHSNPFIFQLFVELIKYKHDLVCFEHLSLISNEINQLLKKGKSTNNKKTKEINHLYYIYSNIVNLLKFFYYVIIEPDQQLDTILNEFKNFMNDIIINEGLFYLNILFPINADKSMTISQIVVDIFLHLKDPVKEMKFLIEPIVENGSPDKKYSHIFCVDLFNHRIKNKIENKTSILNNVSLLSYIFIERKFAEEKSIAQIIFIRKIADSLTNEQCSQLNLNSLFIQMSEYLESLNLFEKIFQIININNLYLNDLKIIKSELQKEKPECDLIIKKLKETEPTPMQNITCFPFVTEEENNLDNLINLKLSIKEKRSKSIMLNIRDKEKYFSFFEINNNTILCLKRDLLLKNLSVFFKNVYFYDVNFAKIKNSYYLQKLKLFKKHQNYNETVYDNDKITFTFPSKLRNYSNCESNYPKIFLKQNLSFYTSETFKVSHNYIYNINPKLYFIKPKPIFPHFPVIDRNKSIFFFQQIIPPFTSFKCEYIYNQGFIFGEMRVTNQYILFINKKIGDLYNNIEYTFGCFDKEEVKKDKVILILLSEIEQIMQKRFLLMKQAIEIYLYNGKTYFFNFFENNQNDLFLNLLSESKYCKNKIVRNVTEHFNQMNYMNKWKRDEIDTFRYLLIINKYATRSYNDLNQYPVLPWTFFINNNEEHTERNFDYPISAQSKENQEGALDCFNVYSGFPVHFRLHYSTRGFITYYLSRLSPFTENQIMLQKDKFDSPDRQFNSFSNLLRILNRVRDSRELIPELFASFEYFYNLNQNDFGEKSYNKLRVNNLQREKNKDGVFQSPMDFVYSLRLHLNSKEIKQKINKWIDIIFGKKQSEFKEKDLITFNKYSYESKVNLNKKKEKFLKEITEGKKTLEKVKQILFNKKVKILSFGQTPYQLFTINHPKSDINDNHKNDEDEIGEVYDLYKNGSINNSKENEIIIYFNFTLNNDFLYFLIKKGEQYRINLYTSKELKIENSFPIEYIESFSLSISNPEQKSQDTHMNISNDDIFSNSKEAKEDNIQNVHLFNPKYSIFSLQKGNFFILGRHYDNSIKVYKSPKKRGENPIIKSFYTESFASVILLIEHSKSVLTFLSGHKNGRIIEWNIKEEKDDITISVKKDIISHDNSMITSIGYIAKHNIIISCAIDGSLYIRKYYDFELMTVMQANRDKFFFSDFIFSDYDLIYVKEVCFDSFKTYIIGYSFNGIEFLNEEINNFEQFEVTKKGKILLLTYFNRNVLLLNGRNLDVLREFNMKKIIKENNDNNNNNNQIITRFLLNEERIDLFTFYFLNKNGEVNREKYVDNN